MSERTKRENVTIHDAEAKDDKLIIRQVRNGNVREYILSVCDWELTRLHELIAKLAAERADRHYRRYEAMKAIAG
jgi:cobalamin biosynthesis protein CbiD